MSQAVQIGAAGWSNSTPPPASFDYRKQAAFQRRIDEAIGTRNGRSLMKLVWAPDELRWMPHALPTDPPGYVLPIFCTGVDEQGRFVAPERWVLLERIEPEQYASTWEQGRYSVFEGQVWDWKGPCPSERYIELRCHSYHDGECCSCRGDTCNCGQEYAHCWGKYAEPDDRLLEWVRKTAKEAASDPDVAPTTDAREFTAPQAQRDLASATINAQQKRQEEIDEFSRKMLDYYLRSPVSTNGLRRTESGIYLLN